MASTELSPIQDTDFTLRVKLEAELLELTR
jgi:hypothetical protein